MSLRFHEIAEQNHRILNPFTHAKLDLLGEICNLNDGTNLLDLCCGKAEMLCQWSRRWGIKGTGVDISSTFLKAARKRADQLEVTNQLTLIEADASEYQPEASSFDIVSCIGASWIGGGLVGTLTKMRAALKPGGILLVGEPYWIDTPPETLYELMGMSENTYTSLIGTLDRIRSVDMELVEMVLADRDSWDRYVAAQWLTVDTWLRAHPDDPDASELKTWNDHWKRIYLEFQRQYFGWGVFVIR